MPSEPPEVTPEFARALLDVLCDIAARRDRDAKEAEVDSGWAVHGERTAFEHPHMQVRAVDVTAPSGERFDYHVVELSPIALAVIVVEGSVLLLWKHRFPTDQWGYELPGGLVDPGEDAASAAAREAIEESGWRVRGEPSRLLSMQPLPGSVRAHTEVWCWTAAEYVGDSTDPEEAATRVEWVELDRVPGLVGDGLVLGAATSTALLYLHATRASTAR